MRPRPQGLYRILAVAEPDYQHLVGKLILVHTVGESVLNMHQITGAVTGQLGTLDITAALERAQDKCRCPAYSFPHRRGKTCIGVLE